MSKHKKIRFIIHYVKPTAQLLFKIRFPKGGPTCRRQVVNPRHQNAARTISCKAWNSPAEYPSWVARCDIKGSVSTVLNPIFSKKVQGWHKDYNFLLFCTLCSILYKDTFCRYLIQEIHQRYNHNKTKWKANGSVCCQTCRALLWDQNVRYPRCTAYGICGKCRKWL